MTRRLHQWLAQLKSRYWWVDFGVRAFGRYQRTEATVSAAHISYAAFFSIFPLAFAAVGVLGLILAGYPELREEILSNAAAKLPGSLEAVVVRSLDSATRSARASLGIGLGLLLWSGTGMVVAAERGLSRAFGAERRAGMIGQRARALGWLASVGVLLAASVLLAGAVGGAREALLGALGIGGGAAEVLGTAAGLLLSFAVDVALFLATLLLLPARRLRPRQVLPAALAAAVWWGLLKAFGAWYVSRAITAAGEVFGQFAIIVGLLVFINLAANLLLLTATAQAEWIESGSHPGRQV